MSRFGLGNSEVSQVHLWYSFYGRNWLSAVELLKKSQIIKSKVDAVGFNFTAISVSYCRDSLIRERRRWLFEPGLNISTVINGRDTLVLNTSYGREICHIPFSILFQFTQHFALYKFVYGKHGALLDKLLMYLNFCSFYLGRRVSSLDDFLIWPLLELRLGGWYEHIAGNYGVIFYSCYLRVLFPIGLCPQLIL